MSSDATPIKFKKSLDKLGNAGEEAGIVVHLGTKYKKEDSGGRTCDAKYQDPHHNTAGTEAKSQPTTKAMK